MTIDPSMDLSFVLTVLIATLLALFVIIGVLTWAIIKVRKDRATVMLVVSVGVLTLVAILTFALTKQNVLATLAGAGMGALAASLTNSLRDKPNPPEERSEEHGSDPQ